MFLLCSAMVYYVVVCVIVFLFGLVLLFCQCLVVCCVSCVGGCFLFCDLLLCTPAMDSENGGWERGGVLWGETRTWPHPSRARWREQGGGHVPV